MTTGSSRYQRATDLAEVARGWCSELSVLTDLPHQRQGLSATLAGGRASCSIVFMKQAPPEVEALLASDQCTAYRTLATLLLSCVAKQLSSDDPSAE